MFRKVKFVPNEYYHIYIRTLLSAPHFKNSGNVERLMLAFLLSNSTTSGAAFDYLRSGRYSTNKRAIEIAAQGEKLVDILSYCVMPNHYHLLLKELRDDGISDFVRKCNTSIAKYINIKDKRRGPLFESRFNSKHIDSNEYLVHLSAYIHLNPLDIISGKEWREHKLENWKSNKKELLEYPYSSLKHFLRKEEYNDPIISGEKIIFDQFKNADEYELFLREWSEEFSDETGLRR